MKKRLLVFLILLLAVVPFAAADIYISNSRDWRDVYSLMVYGNIKEEAPRFLVSDNHGSLILPSIRKEETIEVFTSDSQPFVVGYESMIKNEGYASVTEEKYGNMNLELAEMLPDVKDFIIIDDAYGYNSIAVAPYAVLTTTYVLFANSNNIGDVMDLLGSRDVNSVIIYGHVDREVLEELDEYNPEIINKDGDRFANNVEIVKKYRDINPKQQVVLTNGEFIEAEIMSGLEPVLFIGRENVPAKINEYIQSTDIEVGVLIGNELVGTATIVRRQVGISTFVKFAQGSRSAAGAIAQVEGLDMFPVPKVSINLEILSVKYNKLTGMVEITFKNNADVAAYFKGTYTLKVGDEEFVFGDEDAMFIDKNDVKTMVYKVDGVAPEGEMTLDAYVIYGESKNAMEFVIDETFSVSTIEVGDEAQIEITKVQYDKTADRFLIHIENIGEVTAYVNTELVDIMVMGETLTIGSEDTIRLERGKTGYSIVRVELSNLDLEDNPTVHIRAHYGEREDSLIKILEGDFEISIKTFSVWTYLPIIIIVLLILLLLLGRKRCPSCGHKNPRGRKHCKKCGRVLK
ncbi:zinc ribbon domain-containing protein [Candidatus Woesearchaeota archaeon]|nr:zinc ribbon domain-containing protein [Candidatus Woesearchaeota archaeon]